MPQKKTRLPRRLPRFKRGADGLERRGPGDVADLAHGPRADAIARGAEMLRRYIRREDLERRICGSLNILGRDIRELLVQQGATGAWRDIHPLLDQLGGRVATYVGLRRAEDNRPKRLRAVQEWLARSASGELTDTEIAVVLSQVLNKNVTPEDAIQKRQYAEKAYVKWMRTDAKRRPAGEREPFRW